MSGNPLHSHILLNYLTLSLSHSLSHSHSHTHYTHTAQSLSLSNSLSLSDLLHSIQDLPRPLEGSHSKQLLGQLTTLLSKISSTKTNRTHKRITNIRIKIDKSTRHIPLPTILPNQIHPLNIISHTKKMIFRVKMTTLHWQPKSNFLTRRKSPSPY